MKRLRVSEHAFELRPASVEEAGLFYSDEEKDKTLGTVGHLRMDFGSGGNGFQNTTGFRCETLTDDPEIRKAVDDIILDFAGEENPRRTCNYGLTERGLQALRDVADPSLPHTYAWFVMTDCNTPQEELHRDLTLDEAIQLFQDSDRPEKRLGVTKDAFATVDIVRMVDGAQSFFTDYQKLESFKNDPAIFEAVEQVHQELENLAQDQGMTM